MELTESEFRSPELRSNGRYRPLIEDGPEKPAELYDEILAVIGD